MQIEYRISHEGTHTTTRTIPLLVQPDGTWLAGDTTTFGPVNVVVGVAKPAERAVRLPVVEEWELPAPTPVPAQPAAEPEPIIVDEQPTTVLLVSDLAASAANESPTLVTW